MAERRQTSTSASKIYRGCLKNKIGLVAFDLDGTLINTEGLITEKTGAAVRALGERGVIPVICTGRLYRGAEIYASELGISAPLAVMNGALVRSAGETLICTPLGRDYVKKAVKYCLAEKIYFHIYIDDFLIASAMEYGALYYQNFNKRLPAEGRIEILLPRDPLDFVKKSSGSFLKIMVMSDKPEILEKASFVLRDDRVSVDSSWENNIEIFSSNASKGTAIRFFSEYFGIDSSRIAAFGDNTNDVEMLAQAGFGVAMGNAVPALKNIAHYITDDNNNDGVGKALEFLFDLQ